MDPQIASRLASGTLRRDNPVKTRFAKGREGDCAACEVAIEPTQMTCETAFADLTVLRFHRDCYYAWHAARGAPFARVKQDFRDEGGES